MAAETILNVKAEAKAASSGAAGRMRRRRARHRAGFRCFMVELHRSEIDTLVDGGFLRADERDDEGAVIDALSQYIEQTLGSALCRRTPSCVTRNGNGATALRNPDLACSVAHNPVHILHMSANGISARLPWFEHCFDHWPPGGVKLRHCWG